MFFIALHSIWVIQHWVFDEHVRFGPNLHFGIVKPVDRSNWFLTFGTLLEGMVFFVSPRSFEMDFRAFQRMNCI